MAPYHQRMHPTLFAALVGSGLCLTLSACQQGPEPETPPPPAPLPADTNEGTLEDAAIRILEGEELASLLELDFDSFDQTMDGGWRAYASDGQYRLAARLIDAYVERKPALADWQISVSRFHAGQMYAFADEPAVAIERFKESFQAAEPPDSPVRWNAYVHATIAFLEGDRERLKEQREIIAAGPRMEGRIPNLNVVDSFLANIDAPYSVAYRDAANH